MHRKLKLGGFLMKQQYKRKSAVKLKNLRILRLQLYIFHHR